MADPLSSLAIALLTPLINDVARYIAGGRRTKRITGLPKKLQSEIELERLKQRARSKT